MMLALPLVALGACGDDITNPDGLMASAEAEVVMRSAEALPLLPQFLDLGDHAPASQQPMLHRARELWDAGTAADDPRAAARRRLAVSYALPVLLEVVPAEDWTETRERVDDWMVTASAMLRHLSIPEVEARIRAAAHQLERSDAARSERSRAYYLLLAGSELVETTPRFVARTMVRDAGVAVRAAASEDAAPVAAAALRRAERMKDWSATAVEEGDYLLAIQRAYYAIQLVEGR